MNWQGGRRSSNIEDRRGMRVGAPVAIGGGGLVLTLILSLLFGRNLFSTDTGGPVADDGSGYGADYGSGYGGSGAYGGAGRGGGAVTGSPAEESLKDFASVVLADTEDTWPGILRQQGVDYVNPHLVLYRDAANSGCGFAQSAVGPFYCPRDERVYLDLSFFDELERKYGAPGDFAQAYVIAHEVGHHVQKLLGISDQVERAESSARSQADANALSVRLELQADCFAGIWANHAQAQRHILEAGDIEEGLGAAAAVGDDTLQRRARGKVMPETFTHGSAQQRMTWFKRGFEAGTLDACDTFGGR